MASIKKYQLRDGTWRWNVRWRAAGRPRERSFPRAKAAENFKRHVESEELRGVAFDPQRGAITFSDYAERWLSTRRLPDGRSLAPRTVELYRALLDRQLLTTFGRSKLSSIRVEDVRRWHHGAADRFGAIQSAKGYRLLRAILNTAIEDERIAQNPCRIRGAGVERSPERPFVDAEIVLALAGAIEERYTALVLLAGFGGLRLGELLALRRRDIDLEAGTVKVERQTVELKHGERLETDPKTDAGRRVVHLPQSIVAALERHIARFCSAGPEAPVFTGPLSSGLRRATFYSAWADARRSVGLLDIHLHDLRHAAGTLAAQTGATTKELMARLGHASPDAAHRYQHAASRRDRTIADALEVVLAEAARLQAPDDTTAAPEVPRGNRGRAPSEAEVGASGEGENAPSPAPSPGAGDENRTRVLSLGS